MPIPGSSGNETQAVQHTTQPASESEPIDFIPTIPLLVIASVLLARSDRNKRVRYPNYRRRRW